MWDADDRSTRIRVPKFASITQSASDLRDEATILARLTRDLPAYLRTPMTYPEGVERVRDRLKNRERNFVSAVERAIYNHPRSPYLALLRNAGCKLGDFKRLVAQSGVEGALQTLSGQGVYATYDEFKGRVPAIRGSARFEFSERDFDSPILPPHLVAYTSGTGGRPGRVQFSLAYTEENATTLAAVRVAHDLTDEYSIFMLTSPLPHLFSRAKLGQRELPWYRPSQVFPLKARLGSRYLNLLGRVTGHDFMVPRFGDTQRPDRIAAWLGSQRQAGRTLGVLTMPSVGARIAVSALEAGIDLTGVTFVLQSEPVTATRYQHMLAAGARALVLYATMEMMMLGYSCASPQEPDDMHLNTDRYALVERERLAGEGGPTVKALTFTTLTDTVPKICFNTETGDYAQVESRDCTCLLGSLGLTTHISEVRSFEKLTGEGVSFMRSGLLRILEEVLPARFGGTGMDYQLIEEEAANSSASLVLRVRPEVGPIAPDALRDVLLEELGRGGGIVDHHHAELLRRAGSVVVVRQPPRATAVGKVMPVILLRQSADGS
jgi:hypothetical protein